VAGPDEGTAGEADRGRLELAVAGALNRIGDLTGWHDCVVAAGTMRLWPD